MSLSRSYVAPLAGAWIEIGGLHDFTFYGNASHPSRVRGLKLTLFLCLSLIYLMSHPSRVRGLKYRLP